MAQVDADRNLLFGILAVQNGFIDQADLIGAIQSWSRERSRPIGQVMADRGALSEEDRLLLDGLVRRHVAKHGGAAERSLSAIPAPGALADRVRSTIALDQDMEASLDRLSARGQRDLSDRSSLTIGIGSTLPDDDSAQWDFSLGQTTSEGGRFHLVRRHARGGIGMVFVALDSELHREVALKQMLPQHADDPLSRSRFLIEAEVTGRLEHPGIVPVYGLGSNAQGRPFYAMRFVRGQSLKEAIEEFHGQATPAASDSPGESGRIGAGSSGEPGRVSARSADELGLIGARNTGEPGRVSDGSAGVPGRKIAEGAHGEPSRVSAGRGWPLKTRGDYAAPLALRKLLRRFVDVCNAIAYAHSRGVIHRDLKPANVLLGPYGETLVVDWGLAKIVGRDDPIAREATDRTLRPESQSSSSETVVGTAIGTPAYMSPEQAGGLRSHIGPSSDVYSLGATLYVLLTGKPPQDDPDLDEVLGRTQRGEIVPPRQVNPSVPPALEAVVLKAMALKPADRYSSARALAEEIERWLADEPVQAWRESAFARLRRWMRRRQTLVATMAVAVLVAVVGLAAVLYIQTRANEDLKSANFNLRLANRTAQNANKNLERANQRERSRFDLALSAIKTFHTGVSEDFLLKEPQFEGLRAKLLANATDFYERLEGLLKGQADTRSRAALGQAYHEIGELTAKIGSPVQALAALKRGLELRRRLANDAESYQTAKLELGQSLIAIGDIHEATGDSANAIESYQQAREVVEPFALLELDGEPYRAAEARCLHGIAEVQYHRGDAAAALASHEEARAIRQTLAEANPTAVQYESELANSYHDIGSIHRAGGHAGLALDSYSKARSIREKLAKNAPGSTQFASDLAQSHEHIGFLLQETGHPAAALESIERARTILQQLVRDNPAVTLFQGELAQCYQVSGSIQAQTGNKAEALASYDRARGILQRLADANPALTLFQTRLALNHAFVGQVRQRAGRPADAANEFRRAVDIVTRVCELQPDGYNLYNLACYLSLLSGVASQKGSGLTPEQAHSLGADAVEALRRAVGAGLRDFAFMRRDADLDPLRLRPDFQMLMLDLAFPDEPFARN
jgi:serine/threonine protein kinase